MTDVWLTSRGGKAAKHVLRILDDLRRRSRRQRPSRTQRLRSARTRATLRLTPAHKTVVWLADDRALPGRRRALASRARKCPARQRARHRREQPALSLSPGEEPRSQEARRRALSPAPALRSTRSAADRRVIAPPKSPTGASPTRPRNRRRCAGRPRSSACRRAARHTVLRAINRGGRASDRSRAHA